MNIFSTIGSAIGGVYNTVKSAVSSAASAIGSFLNSGGGAGQTASVYNAASWMTDPKNQAPVPASLKSQGQTVAANYGAAPTPTSIHNGVAYYNGNTPTVSNIYFPQGGTTSIPSGGGYSTGSPAQNMTPVPRSLAAGSKPSTNTASYSTNPTTGFLSSTSLAPSAPSNLSIGANQLGAGTPSVITPSSPSGTNYAGNVLAGNVAVGGDPTTGMMPVTSTGTPATKEKTFEEQLKERIASYRTPENQAELYRRSVQEAGLMQARQNIQNTQNQINAITTKMNTDLLQLRGTAAKEGVTEAVYGGQQAQVTREATIKLLPLQAQLAVDQGNLEMAQENTNTLFKIYSEDAKNSVDFYNKNVDAVWELLSEKEKQKAQDILWQKNRNAEVVDQQATRFSTIANEFLKAGNMAAYRAATSIQLPSNMQSPTFAQDLQKAISAFENVVSQYGGSIGAVARATDAQQLENARLQGEKLKVEIAANQPVTGEYASVINGAAGLVASTKKSTVKMNIANAIANNDFSTAYAEIANAVSDGLTGTNKTKFDDARTDINVMLGMKKAITDYAAQGGDMNILKGTEEEIKRKLGIDSGKASVLATQLWREFQTYRSNMTGAAFTPEESRDYASVNPTLGKSLNLNLNVIDAAVNQLSNRVTSTINARVPGAQGIYEKVNGLSSSGDVVKVQLPDGRTGTIPKENLDAALKAGAKQI